MGGRASARGLSYNYKCTPYGPCNQRGVPTFSYELADFFLRFPNELQMFRMRLRMEKKIFGNGLGSKIKSRHFRHLLLEYVGKLPIKKPFFQRVADRI